MRPFRSTNDFVCKLRLLPSAEDSTQISALQVFDLLLEADAQSATIIVLRCA